ncbi:hypothetical protein ACTG9Q_13395 [Actinokineospora sp. 24-640]
MKKTVRWLVTAATRVAAGCGGRCWICGLTAVAGEKLPGRRGKTRLLCAHYDRLVLTRNA